MRSSVYEIRCKTEQAYQVRDLAEVDLDAALVEVGVAGRVVDELRELALPHLGGAVAEYEQKCVDSV